METKTFNELTLRQKNQAVKILKGNAATCRLSDLLSAAFIIENNKVIKVLVKNNQ